MELPYGVIVDILASRADHDTVTDLVAFALEVFRESVSGVQCGTSVRQFAQVLRECGFYPVKTERPNCVVEDDAIRKRLQQTAVECLFSKADHDWDQIDLA